MTLKVRHFMTQISVQGGTKIMEHIFAGDKRSEETTLYSGKNQMWVDQSVRTPSEIVIRRASSPKFQEGSVRCGRPTLLEIKFGSTTAYGPFLKL